MISTLQNRELDGIHATGNGEALGAARQKLYERFESRIHVSPVLTRKLVSYQGNKNAPGLRWLKYKEGFSSHLVRLLLDEARGTRVLDPFSGAGTTVLTACGMGLQGTGIEIMPVGNLGARAIAMASHCVDTDPLRYAGSDLLAAIAGDSFGEEYLFPHVPITEQAFPASTEYDLARARQFIAGIGDTTLTTILTLACVSVLEEVSYTRKDGQFLRWDPQSGRRVSRKLHKDSIPSLSHALGRRLDEIVADIPVLRRKYDRADPFFIDGSSLTTLKGMASSSFDAVVTSPPYANRYDYTRTYALELAYLGYGISQFKELRQALLTATVENKSKREALGENYGDGNLFLRATSMTDEQAALQEVLDILRSNIKLLSNASVIGLVQNYFTEMAIIICELGRLLEMGGSVFMVNDNVQYHGEEVPVDLILSDFAEQSGFRCEAIWTLTRGKGNSSQQMGRFGRQELRKCVYHWVKVDGGG